MKKVYWHIEKQMIKYHLSSSETKAQTTTEIWRGIEVVITRRSWKPFVRKGAWVRIPPSPLLEKYPSWPKGLPWKGSRSLVAARGFKSLLLRLFKTEFRKGIFTSWKTTLKCRKRMKKFLTSESENDKLLRLIREKRQRKRIEKNLDKWKSLW